MSDSAIPDALVSFLHAVSEDGKLSGQLLNLERLPLPSRQAALRDMAAQVRESGEDAAVADAIEALVQKLTNEIMANLGKK